MDQSLPVIKFLLKLKDEHVRPRPRTYVVCWYQGGISAGQSGVKWEKWPGWFGSGKEDPTPFEQRAKGEEKPIYQCKEVIQLLRDWDWTEHRLTWGLEFCMPLPWTGCDSEEDYNTFLLALSVGKAKVTQLPLDE
jgi:hypothetical protein